MSDAKKKCCCGGLAEALAEGVSNEPCRDEAAEVEVSERAMLIQQVETLRNQLSRLSQFVKTGVYVGRDKNGQGVHTGDLVSAGDEYHDVRFEKGVLFPSRIEKSVLVVPYDDRRDLIPSIASAFDEDDY